MFIKIKNILLFILLFIILFFIFIEKNKDIFFSSTHVSNFLKKNFIVDKIVGYYLEKPLFYLEIPAIELKQNIYSIDSDLNDVDKNIELLKETDVDRNLYFIAGHSGYGDNSYFNNLFLLKEGDIIYINQLTYIVDSYYYIDKKGFMDITIEENTLYLITCSLVYNDKQLIIKSRLLM